MVRFIGDADEERKKIDSTYLDLQKNAQEVKPDVYKPLFETPKPPEGLFSKVSKWFTRNKRQQGNQEE